MARYSHAHTFIGRRFDVAARVASSRLRYSFEVFEYGLDAPKTSSRKNSSLLAFGRSQRRIARGRWERELRSFRRSGAEGSHGIPPHDANNQRDCDTPTYKRALHCPAPETTHPSLLCLRRIGCGTAPAGLGEYSHSAWLHS